MKPLCSVQVELTNNCNYKCKFCPQAYYKDKQYNQAPFDRKKGYMELDLFKRIINQCKLFAEEINFSYFGEPTLHPYYFDFFKWLKNNKGDLRIILNSNLSLVTKEIFELWMDVGIHQCRFSIDAFTSATYDKVRPGGLVKDYIDGKIYNPQSRLEKIKEKVMWWFSQQKHCSTRHVFVVCSNNKHEIKDYVNFWEKWLGPNDEILIKNVLTYGGVIHKGTPGFDKMIFNNSCNVWQQNSLTVAWNGDVTPCNLDVNVGLKLGNITELSLAGMHKNDRWKKLKQLSDDRKISPCITCHDANNWTNNIVIKKGGMLSNRQLEVYK